MKNEYVSGHGNWSVSRNEIGQLLNALKKSPGLDEITNEMLKYGGDDLIQEFLTLFNKIVTTR